LELSTLNAPNAAHIHRREQPMIDSIVRGEHAGGYYLMIGPKGTGKGTMIVEWVVRPTSLIQLISDSAMRKISAEGASFCEGK
jgi:hypothetical protein